MPLRTPAVHSNRTSAHLAFVVVAIGLSLLTAAGCKPQIGDSCEFGTDCSASGDRLCDTTQPGGYCTMFNCDSDSCPDDSVCIGFRARASTVAECSDPHGESRFQRSFCMAPCDDDDDCRSGYECVDMRASDNPYGAAVIEARSRGKVCAVPASGKPIGELDPATDVCRPSQAGPDAWPSPVPPDAGTPGSGGAAGAGGNAGAGGASGQGGGAGAGGVGAGGAAGSSGAGGAVSGGAGGQSMGFAGDAP